MCLELSETPSLTSWLSLEMHEVHFELVDGVTARTVYVLVSTYKFFIRITHAWS